MKNRTFSADETHLFEITEELPVDRPAPMRPLMMGCSMIGAGIAIGFYSSGASILWAILSYLIFGQLLFWLICLRNNSRIDQIGRREELEITDDMKALRDHNAQLPPR